MMEKYVVTAEAVTKANDYLPLAKKNEFVDYCAQKCFARVSIHAGEAAGDEFPPMYVENSDAKSRYLMGALCLLYLPIGAEFADEDDPYLITEEQYDALAASHVMNQLERLKSNAALRDKVFDILADYKDLEKRLNTAVYGFMSVMNDPVARQSVLMQTEMGRLPGLMGELQALQTARETKEE